jgi:hypothetical protein
MKWLGAFFLAVILPLLLSEFTDWCPWFARRLVRRAARRLPKHSRARWEEEWLDHLNALATRRSLSARTSVQVSHSVIADQLNSPHHGCNGASAGSARRECSGITTRIAIPVVSA